MYISQVFCLRTSKKTHLGPKKFRLAVVYMWLRDKVPLCGDITPCPCSVL